LGFNLVATNTTGTTMSHQILLGDCRDRLKELPDNSIDSIVTDPPYELGFMGKSWDASGVAYDVTVWQECLRVLKPGGHLLSFGGSRTYHRMACAIEDAGFQIRDQIMWVYGSGFPKSLNVSKSIEGLLTTGSANKTAFKHLAGEQVERGNWGIAKQQFTHGQRDTNYDETASATVLGKLEPTTDEAKEWEGWGTALKPAHEPIVLARKPLDGTVANNVLMHGVGGINIDGCRVGDEIIKTSGGRSVAITGDERVGAALGMYGESTPLNTEHQGRFPANFIHDGSDEVLELFPETKGGTWNTTKGARHFNNDGEPTGYATSKSDGSTGSAARFFYCAKASKNDRNEGLDGFAEKRPDERTTTGMGTFDEKGVAKQANHHPTVKPTELMRYLCRLVTPLNGTVLDPFTGSGSTGKAAVLEGFSFIGVEQSEEYIAIAEARIQSAKEDK
jgi:site-specific DNA-methyltransferase (adenine-specific)